MSERQIAQKSPYVNKEIKPGKYAWCACGKSQKQPFCDGSHKGSGMAPVVVVIDEKTAVAWCGCKHTKNPPYCDGTHSTIS